MVSNYTIDRYPQSPESIARPSIMPDASPTFCGRSSCDMATATANVDQRKNPNRRIEMTETRPVLAKKR